MSKLSLNKAIEEFEDSIDNSLCFIKTGEMVRIFRHLKRSLRAGEIMFGPGDTVTLEYHSKLPFDFVCEFIDEIKGLSKIITDVRKNSDTFFIEVKIPDIKNVILVNGGWDDI